MKKYLILIIALFISNIGIVLADDCAELQPVLDQFYSASKDENIKDFMAIIDKDYVKKNLLDNYEDYVKSAWKVYDVSNYKITPYNCKIDWKNAIFYFNLKSTIIWGKKTVDSQRNYVWVFHKLDNWKIRYVMDEENFDKYLNAKYSNLFVKGTKDIIDKEINNANQLVKEAQQLSGQLDTWKVIQSNNNDNYKNNKANNIKKIFWWNKWKNNYTYRLIWIILLSIILFILYKFIKFQDYKKIEELDNKQKSIFILRKCWEYLKEYLKIVWALTIKIYKLTVKILQKIYIKWKPIISELIKKISKKKNK